MDIELVYALADELGMVLTRTHFGAVVGKATLAIADTPLRLKITVQKYAAPKGHEAALLCRVERGPLFLLMSLVKTERHCYLINSDFVSGTQWNSLMTSKDSSTTASWVKKVQPGILWEGSKSQGYAQWVGHTPDPTRLQLQSIALEL